MKRMYEAVIVFDGSLPDETLVAEQEKIESFLKKNAAFEKTEVWGKKTMAYEINKKKSGHYCAFIFNGEGDTCDALKKSIKLNQNVLRHLSVLYEETPEISKEIMMPRKPEEESEGRRRGR